MEPFSFIFFIFREMELSGLSPQNFSLKNPLSKNLFFLKKSFFHISGNRTFLYFAKRNFLAPNLKNFLYFRNTSLIFLIFIFLINEFIKRFKNVMIYICHKMLLLLKNHLNYLKDFRMLF